MVSYDNEASRVLREVETLAPIAISDLRIRGSESRWTIIFPNGQFELTKLLDTICTYQGINRAKWTDEQRNSLVLAAQLFLKVAA